MVPPEAVEASVSYVDAWNAMICETSEAKGFACGDVGLAFNGADGRTASGDLLAPDYIPSVGQGPRADRQRPRRARVRTAGFPAAVTRYVVLLRGINVGGKNPVPMARLREVLGELGYEDVVTYIASGNVILNSDHKPDRIKREIEEPSQRPSSSTPSSSRSTS